MDGAFAGALPHLRDGPGREVNRNPGGAIAARHERDMQQNQRNILTGLILAAIAIGIFLYTLMKAGP